MTKQDLQARAKQFSLRVFKLIDALPRTTAGRICADQLGRAGSSVAANYRAACRARSHREFISKLGTCEEESDESEFWLDMIVSIPLVKPKLVIPLLNEANELTRIMSASRITAQRSAKS